MLTSTGTVSCDADGYAVISGCDSQQSAYIACAICQPSAQDDACDTCGKSSCCSEMQAAYTDASFNDYLGCVMGCTDATCQADCGTQYPTASAAFAAANQCVSTNCATQCQ